MSYTAFFERLKKFEEMRLAELRAVTGRGRTREIVLRYDGGEGGGGVPLKIRISRSDLK